ncbi:MAG: hypothetical protein ACR2NP_19315 [Pirellulaceae bacterium]
MSEEKTPANEEGSEDQMADAKDVAGQAADQAKEFAGDAAAAIKGLEPNRLYFLIALVVFFLCTTFFNMVAFSVSSENEIAQSIVSNAWISVMQSGWAGFLAWALALAAIIIVVWSAMTGSDAAWIPLAEAACAGVALLLMLLLLLVSFSDSVTDDVTIRVSARLLGFWLPFLAIVAATFFGGMRFLETGGLDSVKQKSPPPKETG